VFFRPLRTQGGVMVSKYAIILVALTAAGLIWKIKPYFTGLAIRRAIKESVNLIPRGTYRGLSTFNPRVCGVINGYEVQFGASISHPYSNTDVSLFEKVKLKHPPQLSLTEKDYFRLYVCDENLSLEWGWLTRYHHIAPSNQSENHPQTDLALRLPQKRQLVSYTPSETLSQANQMLKESTFNNIKRLIEIAREIDTGSLDIATQISENTKKAHREFLIGILVTIGAIVFWLVAFLLYGLFSK
jgi:hypothetical protein